MAKGYILRVDSIDLEEHEFYDAMDISKAIGGGFLDHTKLGFPLNREQEEAYAKVDVWCDDVGMMKGLPRNLDNVMNDIVGDVVLLGRKMTMDGEDIADVSYEDAKIVAESMWLNPARRKIVEDRSMEADEINKNAKMTKDSIITGVVLEPVGDMKKDELDSLIIDCMEKDMRTADYSYFNQFPPTLTDKNYVQNGLSFSDAFFAGADNNVIDEKETKMLYIATPEDTRPWSRLEEMIVPGRFEYGNEGTSDIAVTNIDAYKFAAYLKEKHGIETKPRVVEYGRICEDGKFRLQMSEVRKFLMLKDVKEMNGLKNKVVSDLSPDFKDKKNIVELKK